MGLFTPLLTWYVTLLILGLVSLPIALLLFEHLPDHGYAFARALGLLFIGYAAWLLSILGLAHFTNNLLLFVTLCIGVSGWIVLPRRQGRVVALRTRWLNILGYELLFLVAFLFMVWLRSYDPNPQGTERPMDYALYNAIMRSQTFPPHDPWLSGYAINYYYFGYLLMGVPTLLSGIDPAIGYNLSLATLFALTAVHVAALVYNLIALRRDAENSKQAGAAPKVAAPLVAVLLVLILGNQAGTLEVLARTEKVVALNAQQTWIAVENGIWGDARILHLPYPTPDTQDFGVIQDVALGDEWSDFNWWWPSRALWDDRTINGVTQRVYNITEFPFFSFYLGDMHPHVMSLPFTILAAGLVLRLMARGRIPQLWNRDPGETLLFGLCAAILGTLYFFNSWDMPTYGLLLVLGLLWMQMRNGARERPRWRRWTVQVGMLLLSAILLYLPFYLTFRSFAGALTLPPLVERLPVVRTLANLIGIVYWSKSSLHQVWIIFGLFMVPISGYMLSARPQGASHQILDSSPSRPGRFGAIGHTRTPWGWIILISFIAGLIIQFPLLGLAPVVAYALLVGLRTSNVSTAFAYFSIALLSAILLGADIFFIPDVFGNRMNTIFKFYYQIWALGGVLAAYALWAVMQRPTLLKARYLQFFTLVVFIVLSAGAAVYPVLALRQRMSGTVQGLRGLTAREMRNVGEQEAVAWLESHSSPDAVVLEAVGASYDSTGTGAGGISGATGLQTVLGWQGHEEQWRHGDATALSQVAQRREDVQAIYTSHDSKQVQELLEKYNIRYVVVGEAERQSYRGLDTHVFERLMTKAFTSSNRKVVIFER